ncbi:hypothetical protein L210DRAFT_2997902 [Boletus edulis BED1]|uniref:SNF2 N-terminal domain-containing protein n=1 Tax=Boletus edulis BED1 TaxID=1328754 RepID=A0AAD4BDY5_BOLED|nr:hypothetical protein L210DRAFT_2168776 [Boletus edulis BED1]KAF8431218.1 hypothetical protein L210DRAFT_2997902 [Boletus edulis BED1]
MVGRLFRGMAASVPPPFPYIVLFTHTRALTVGLEHYIVYPPGVDFGKILMTSKDGPPSSQLATTQGLSGGAVPGGRGIIDEKRRATQDIALVHAEYSQLSWEYQAPERTTTGMVQQASLQRLHHFIHACRTVAAVQYPAHVSLLSAVTPQRHALQNDLTELWAILRFLMSCTNFANLKEFGEWFSNPLEKVIEMGMLDDENLKRVSKLHTVLRPYLLRRLKRDAETSTSTSLSTLQAATFLVRCVRVACSHS